MKNGVMRLARLLLHARLADGVLERDDPADAGRDDDPGRVAFIVSSGKRASSSASSAAAKENWAKRSMRRASRRPVRRAWGRSP